ncbi:TPA: hypothetical protein ACHOZW_005467 [Raoultella ornithinolytica]
MRDSEGVTKLPRGRREEALAKPYTKEELNNISEKEKFIRSKNFNTTALNLKYFKM